MLLILQITIAITLMHSPVRLSIQPTLSLLSNIENPLQSNINIKNSFAQPLNQNLHSSTSKGSFCFTCTKKVTHTYTHTHSHLHTYSQTHNLYAHVLFQSHTHTRDGQWGIYAYSHMQRVLGLHQSWMTSLSRGLKYSLQREILIRMQGGAAICKLIAFFLLGGVGPTAKTGLG